MPSQQEEIIKEYEGRFMNNGVNGVLSDIFQDPRTVLTRTFIQEALDSLTEAHKVEMEKLVEEINETLQTKLASVAPTNKIDAIIKEIAKKFNIEVK
jgi:ABC-type methionine transport system ATPase subunit